MGSPPYSCSEIYGSVGDEVCQWSIYQLLGLSQAHIPSLVDDSTARTLMNDLCCETCAGVSVEIQCNFFDHWIFSCFCIAKNK